MREVVKPLLMWFQNNKRDLDFRNSNDPYSILVSEIMLQQTRVEAVKKYFARFMKVLPNFRALANVDDMLLMKLWEGLGYYNRAKNLKKCAKEVVEKYQGVFPNSYKLAIQLPGIGPYTCGAILSRAYALPYAAIDGNVLRVLSRYLGSYEDIMREATRKRFKRLIEDIIPSESGQFNESLMELGAIICTPKKYRCEDCPLSFNCKAYELNIQSILPIKKKANEKKNFEVTCIFLTYEDTYCLLPKASGVLVGLPSPILHFSFLNEGEVLTLVDEQGLSPKYTRNIPERMHVFTHQIWQMKAYVVEVKEKGVLPFYTKDEILETLTVPTCFKQFLVDILN